MDELNVAIIGFGLAGSVFHAPLIASTPGLRLAAVSTSDPQRATAAARFGNVAVHPNASELFDAHPDLDLAVIATPNIAHAGGARDAIERGIAVVVDKPMALNAIEAAELVDMADEARVPLTVFQNRRWDGDYLTVKKLMADGAFGRVTRVESRFERWRPTPKGGWRENLPPEQGGGILLDLGAHLIDQAIALCGPVDDVYAEVGSVREGLTTDDDAFVALQHANGSHSHLWMSAVAADLGPRFRVLGTTGGFHVDGLDGQEQALRDGELPSQTPNWGDDGRTGVLTGIEDEQQVALLPGDYPNFYAQVEQALRGNAPMPVDPRDAVEVLAIIEQARASGSTGNY